MLPGNPGDEPVDANSSLLIMTLGAGPDNPAEVTSDEDALAAVVALGREEPGRVLRRVSGSEHSVVK